MTDKFFFIPNKTNTNVIDELTYDNIYNVKDKSNKHLIFVPINYKQKHFFIETGYLKIIGIKGNKISLQLDDETNKIFDKIDDVSVGLIQNINESKNIFANDIQYLSITNNSILKITVSPNTDVLCNGLKSNISDYQDSNFCAKILGSYARTVIRIGSINIYPNDNSNSNITEDLCHVRTHLNVLDLKIIENNIFSKNISVKNYVFSTNENDIYKNVILDDQDYCFLPTINNPNNNDDKSNDNDSNDNDSNDNDSNDNDSNDNDSNDNKSIDNKSNDNENKSNNFNSSDDSDDSIDDSDDDDSDNSNDDSNDDTSSSNMISIASSVKLKQSKNKQTINKQQNNKKTKIKEIKTKETINEQKPKKQTVIINKETINNDKKNEPIIPLVTDVISKPKRKYNKKK